MLNTKQNIFYMLGMILFFLFSFCSSPEGEVQNQKAKANDINHPDRVMNLSSELNEISDIAYIGNNQLAAIHDEEGIIYVLDASEGKIIDKHKFSGNGDFEGLAINGTTAYAATSDGVIHLIEDYRTNPKVKSFPTTLTDYNNVEGLHYQAAKNQLLVICKNQPGSGLDSKEYKAVYAFDLKNFKLTETPVVKISLKKIKELPSVKKAPAKKKFHFNPSAISIHPVTGNYFAVASSGQLLIEFNQNEEVLKAIPLPGKVFSQPEGITFDEKGGMYIANEASGGNATILYFNNF